MGVLNPNAATVLNPDRTPEFILTSTTEGGAPIPSEFENSTPVTTTTQTGIPIGQSPIVPNYSTLINSRLDQDKTQERKQTLVNADFNGLSLTQQESDPVSGVPVQITKAIVPSIGGVFETNISNGGSGYTSPPVVTGTTPFGGLSAKYGTPVLSGGVVQSVPVIDPGSNFAQNDVLTFTGGGGTGAAGAGTIPAYPSTSSGVSTVDVVMGGSDYTGATTATASAPELGGRIAILGVTIIGGVISDIPVLDEGYGYLNPPTITIVDSGGGSGATTMALLSMDAWYDYTPLDKWRSIQFASRCPDTQAELDLLKVIIPGTMAYPWPPTLQSVSVYREDGSHTEVPTGTFSSVTYGGGYQFDGGVAAPMKEGPRSNSVSSLTRTFWKGYPNITDTITKIQLSTGMVIVEGGAFSQFTTVSASSIAVGQVVDTSDSTKFTVVSIPPCLTNGVTLVYAGSGSQATGTLVLPASTPTVFNPGDVIVSDIRVTQWRFNIYVMEVIRDTFPA